MHESSSLLVYLVNTFIILAPPLYLYIYKYICNIHILFAPFRIPLMAAAKTFLCCKILNILSGYCDVIKLFLKSFVYLSLYTKCKLSLFTLVVLVAMEIKRKIYKKKIIPCSSGACYGKGLIDS